MSEKLPAKLTPKQARFVEEYLVDLNATQAAVRAGYAAKDADVQGPRLLGFVGVSKAITAARKRQAARTEITADNVLKRWFDIATADPRGLIQHCRAPCRYCHGIGHGYQWKTEREFSEAVNEAVSKGDPRPTDEGGYGYRTTRAINPDCPECSGEGVGYTIAADTRNMPESALVLYAGAKQTRDGLEIKLMDQGKALENVARHLGMFVEQNQLLGKDGKPVDPQHAVIVLTVAK